MYPTDIYNDGARRYINEIKLLMANQQNSYIRMLQSNFKAY